jgi:uncharacterized protein
MKFIFYNENEYRLRAGWRITLTTMLVISLLVIFSLLIPGQTGVMIALAFILIGVLWISARVIDKRPCEEFGFTINSAWFLDFFAGNVMAALAMSGIVFVLMVTSQIEFADTNITFFEWDFFSGLISALVLMTAVSIWEEAYFRSYLITNLREGFLSRSGRKHTPVLAAVLVSSVIFGLAHATNPHSSWIALTNITIAGIVLAYPYIKTRSIAISVGMHLSWNYFQGVIFGLPVSGMKMENSITTATVTGSEFITGAEFGPEGGIIGFLGLILMALLCHIYLVLFYKK